jgi:GH24 family phage-related lysozyme (muramidase)
VRSQGTFINSVRPLYEALAKGEPIVDVEKVYDDNPRLVPDLMNAMGLDPSNARSAAVVKTFVTRGLLQRTPIPPNPLAITKALNKERRRQAVIRKIRLADFETDVEDVSVEDPGILGEIQSEKEADAAEVTAAFDRVQRAEERKDATVDRIESTKDQLLARRQQAEQQATRREVGKARKERKQADVDPFIRHLMDVREFTAKERKLMADTDHSTIEAVQIHSDEGVLKVSADGDGISGGRGHRMTKAQLKKYPLGSTIPKDVQERWFKEDIAIALNDAEALVFSEEVLGKDGDLPPEVFNIIVNMAFNLGRTKLKDFKGMFKAIQEGDYDRAAEEMKYQNADTKKATTPWFKQTGRRAKRLIARMKAAA